MSDGTDLGPVLCDTLPAVLVAMAVGRSLRESCVPLDALAARSPRMFATWAAESEAALSAAGARRRFARACAFADARAESPGESLSRVLIHELGFATPELQHRVYDSSGREVARLDFWWPEVRVGGEFDGVGKYDIALHASEEERRRSIRREKEREIDLTRTLGGLARWTWRDLREPTRLEAELLRVGVPRR